MASRLEPATVTWSICRSAAKVAMASKDSAQKRSILRTVSFAAGGKLSYEYDAGPYSSRDHWYGAHVALSEQVVRDASGRPYSERAASRSVSFCLGGRINEARACA